MQTLNLGLDKNIPLLYLLKTSFRSWIRIPDQSPLLSPVRNTAFQTSISQTVTHRSIVTTLSERFITDADNLINTQDFGSDPADIRIQIRINLEIWIRIPDHLQLRLDALEGVCAVWGVGQC